ncbi:MAG: cobalamin-dependent protein [Deltaproteobacteria bacterium]|nr:cobalamin-dependent protein [Deltaproteobacteria bacterium]
MSKNDPRVRVLLAKPGLDGHDRGVYVVAQALRDSGIEVVFLGLQVTPDQVAQAAEQESVDVIGLSIFSGGHMTLVPRIIESLKEKGLQNIPIIVGGIIPPEDAEKLKRNGVCEIFPPGCSMAEVVACVRMLTNTNM